MDPCAERLVESNEPAFLRKLRSEHGGDGSVRNNHPLARPKKQRSDEEDDGPTYVDEESHETVTRAEYNALLERNKDASQATSHEQTTSGPKKISTDDSPMQERPASKQKMAGIGGLGKKRALKTFGSDNTQPSAEQPKEVCEHENKGKNRSSKRSKLSFEEGPLEG